MTTGKSENRWLAAIMDMIAANAAFFLAVAAFRALPGFYYYEPLLNWRALALGWNVAAVLTVVWLPAKKGNALFAGLVLALVFCACVAAGKFEMPGRRRLVTLFVFASAFLAFARLIALRLDRAWTRHGRAGRRLLFVGDSPALNHLAAEVNDDGWKDYAEIVHERGFAPALTRLKEGRFTELYCSLAKETLSSAQEIFDYCENNLVRFYGVPETTEYFGRSLRAMEIRDVTVLTPREEPLRRLANRALKRTLDIVVSLGFLCTLFVPILLLVAYKIKKESPGPVFFRQRRHGLDGKEFLCWKFRSMHVNDRSDTAQTAIDDPRKFPFGDKMRRTNIDELPQFINVLFGDMSLVGPRPHPCKMTDDYGEIVNRYRVRLYAKPGVTGWAQVNGARGATLTIDDMIKRVRLDIWYLEHWSFALDLRILAVTFWQTIAGRNKNAF